MRWKCSARSTHSSDLSPIVVPQIMRWTSPRKLVNGECVAPSAASVLENRITGSVFKDVAAGTPINEVLERTQ